MPNFFQCLNLLPLNEPKTPIVNFCDRLDRLAMINCVLEFSFCAVFSRVQLIKLVKRKRSSWCWKSRS